MTDSEYLGRWTAGPASEQLACHTHRDGEAQTKLDTSRSPSDAAFGVPRVTEFAGREVVTGEVFGGVQLSRRAGGEGCAAAVAFEYAIAATRREVKAAQEQTAAARLEVKALQERIVAVQRSAARLNEALEAVYQSTSWRLTAPLRRFVRILRGRSTTAVAQQQLAYDLATAQIVNQYLSASTNDPPQPLHLLIGSAQIVRERLSSVIPPAEVVGSDLPPRFSIVTPYFAHENFFQLCADSVAALLRADAAHSGVPRIEWIVVNDDPSCPDDKLRAILPPAILPHARILSDGLNHGIATALNNGVRAASNPWILLLDCDDAIEPHALRVLDAHIEQFPKCRYFSSAMIDIDEDNRELRRRRQETPPLALFEAGMVMGHLVAFHRDLFDKIGGFASRFSGVQDYDFALRAAACEPLRQVPDHLYRYRWHMRSQSVARIARQARLADAVRASFLRDLLGPEERKPLTPRPLPPKPRGLCIIRTQGTRIELLAAAVASVQSQEIPMTPCVVVHGSEDARRFVERRLLQELGAELGPAPIFLDAPDLSRRRGYPCNVALDFLSAQNGRYDLLCFLDDDDHLLPGFAACLIDALRQSRADLAYGATNALPTAGEPYLQHQLLPAAALFQGNFIPNNSYLMRTEAVLAAGARFDEELDYLEDWDFLVQLVGRGAQAVPVFATVSEYRLIGDGNAAHKRNPEHFDHCKTIVVGRAAAAAKRLPPSAFWMDILNFPSDRRARMTEAELAQLNAARALFMAPEQS